MGCDLNDSYRMRQAGKAGLGRGPWEEREKERRKGRREGCLDTWWEDF